MDNMSSINNPIITPTPPASPKKNNKDKILILIIAVLLIILVVGFAYIKVQKSFNWNTSIIRSDNVSVNVPGTNIATSTVGTQEILPGASMVNPQKEVINEKFETAKNDAIPNSPDAPKSTVIKAELLPAEALNLKIGNGKITPNSFTVKSGDLISLAATSIDNQVHVFGFYDGAVSAIVMGISEGQTKAINFNAPAPGTYTFGCGVPQHKEKGEVGTMIVK